MIIDREGLESDLRVTYHMLTMMSCDYSGTLPNGYPSVDTVKLKTLPLCTLSSGYTAYCTEITINSKSAYTLGTE